jgi:death-on-curing protein
MTALIWVPVPVVIIIHDRQIARHGGASGLRDRGLLDAACDHAINKFEYGETNIATLTAAYAFGITKAHAFVDGNKRTAFVTAFTFLRLNGFTCQPDPIKGVRVMEDLARDVVSEAEFAEWVKAGMQAI